MYHYYSLRRLHVSPALWKIVHVGPGPGGTPTVICSALYGFDFEGRHACRD